jgi:hypothetical protein
MYTFIEHFHYPVGGGTIIDILFVDMHIVHHPFLGVMGKPGAIPGTDGIDAAHIGLQIEELAGLFYIHPIAALVLIQPFFPKCFFTHAQMTRYPLYVRRGIGGRHGLTTIGTMQTIGLFPGDLVRIRDHLIQTTGGLILQPGQKTSQAFLVVTRDLPKRS